MRYPRKHKQARRPHAFSYIGEMESGHRFAVRAKNPSDAAAAAASQSLVGDRVVRVI